MIATKNSRHRGTTNHMFIASNCFHIVLFHGCNVFSFAAIFLLKFWKHIDWNGDMNHSVEAAQMRKIVCMCPSRGGIGGPDPAGKSQVIWVSIKKKHSDPPPPPPGKSWTPPLENVGPTLDPCESIVISAIKPLDHLCNCKISWGL